MRCTRWGLALAAVSLLATVAAGAEPWRNRKRLGSVSRRQRCGVAQDECRLPVELRPEKAIWATPLPPGHSSPCIWGDRIFLTGFDRAASKLETYCLDRTSGQILWRVQRRSRRRRRFTRSALRRTPRRPPMANECTCTSAPSACCATTSQAASCGSSRSPPGDALRIRQFADCSRRMRGLELRLSARPVVLAVDRRTGREVWRRECLPYLPGYATPVVWSHDGMQEVIVHSSVGVTALRLRDGVQQWWISMLSAAPARRWLPAIVCLSPPAGQGRAGRPCPAAGI